MALGAAFGPFIFGYLADKKGRKLTLLAIAIPFSLSYFLMAFGQIVELFYVARLITGLGLGGVFTVLPNYIGEISEDANRGMLSSAMNVFLTFGSLLSFILGHYISVMAFNLILAVLPIIFFVVFFFVAPESPHFLAAQNQMEEAKVALKKLRSGSITKEFEEIQNDAVQKQQGGSFLSIFKEKSLIKAQIISASLVAFQQFSGIIAILSYASSIFEDAGVEISPAICAIIVGATQFAASFMTPIVADRMGRKILLIISAIGMILTELPLGVYFILKKNGTDVEAVSFLPIVCLMVYIVVYNLGFGPLPWVVMGEIFPSNVKAAASTATAFLCWILAFCITFFFQKLTDSIGIGVLFLIFSGFCAIAGLFTQFYVIETKGKSFQEIQDDLGS